VACRINLWPQKRFASFYPYCDFVSLFSDVLRVSVANKILIRFSVASVADKILIRFSVASVADKISICFPAWREINSPLTCRIKSSISVATIE